jgi:hypothetical protein
MNIMVNYRTQNRKENITGEAATMRAHEGTAVTTTTQVSPP